MCIYYIRPLFIIYSPFTYSLVFLIGTIRLKCDDEPPHNCWLDESGSPCPFTKPHICAIRHYSG